MTSNHGLSSLPLGGSGSRSFGRRAVLLLTLAAPLGGCATKDPVGRDSGAPGEIDDSPMRPKFIQAPAPVTPTSTGSTINSPPPCTMNCPKALFVAGGAMLTAGDDVVRVRLELLGYEVVIQDDDAIDTAVATSTKVVVISESSSSTKVGAKFKDTPVGIVNMEPSILDEMGMTPAMSANGAEGSQLNVKITNAEHPLAAGFSGLVPAVALYSSFLWGTAGDGAIKIAVLEANEARHSIFAYESGATMVVGTAPARRVAFYLTESGSRALSAEGAKLFEAAVMWASSGTASPVTPPGPDGGAPADAAPAADAAVDAAVDGAKDTRADTRSDARDSAAPDKRKK